MGSERAPSVRVPRPRQSQRYLSISSRAFCRSCRSRRSPFARRCRIHSTADCGSPSQAADASTASVLRGRHARPAQRSAAHTLIARHRAARSTARTSHPPHPTRARTRKQNRPREPRRHSRPLRPARPRPRGPCLVKLICTMAAMRSSSFSSVGDSGPARGFLSILARGIDISARQCVSARPACGLARAAAALTIRGTRRARPRASRRPARAELSAAPPLPRWAR
jgi:hypothetical protein